MPTAATLTAGEQWATQQGAGGQDAQTATQQGTKVTNKGGLPTAGREG